MASRRREGFCSQKSTRCGRGIGERRKWQKLGGLAYLCAGGAVEQVKAVETEHDSFRLPIYVPSTKKPRRVTLVQQREVEREARDFISTPSPVDVIDCLEPSADFILPGVCGHNDIPTKAAAGPSSTNPSGMRPRQPGSEGHHG